MNRQIASSRKDRAVLHIARRQPKRWKRARKRTSINVVEITKFRRTLDRKFDVLNKVHPGPGAQFFRRNFTRQSLPVGCRRPGLAAGKWRGNCPFPSPSWNRAREREGKAKKSRDGFIKLNVSSLDKACPRSAASLATGFRTLSARRNRESWPCRIAHAGSASGQPLAMKLNFLFPCHAFVS